MPSYETEGDPRHQTRPNDAAAASERRTHRRWSEVWAAAWERWVCSVNIQRFREQLAMETDEGNRAMLIRLLREHESNLSQLTASGSSDMKLDHAQFGESGPNADD